MNYAENIKILLNYYFCVPKNDKKYSILRLWVPYWYNPLVAYLILTNEINLQQHTQFEK